MMLLEYLSTSTVLVEHAESVWCLFLRARPESHIEPRTLVLVLVTGNKYPNI